MSYDVDVPKVPLLPGAVQESLGTPDEFVTERSETAEGATPSKFSITTLPY